MDELFLELDVDVQGAVQETGTGAAGTILLQGLDAGLDDALVPGEARVGIGTEHQDLVSFHFDFRALFALDFTEIGVDPFLDHFLRQVVLRQPCMQ